MLPTSCSVHSEEDALNCCDYKRWNYESKLPLKTHCWGLYKSFQNENIQRYYQYFLINGTSTTPVIFWIVLFVLYAFAFVHMFQLSNSIPLVREMRICSLCRLLLIVLTFYIYYKILYGKVTPHMEKAKFKLFVNVITHLSNFIIVSYAGVSGVDFVIRSSLSSCQHFYAVNRGGEVEEQDRPDYIYCNPQYEDGSPPMVITLLLFVGNLLAVSSLRCHSSWAAKVNYFIVFVSIVIVAFQSSEVRESAPVMFIAVFFYSIYEGIESSSLPMFGALLNLESNKRAQMSEMKHFIGNVAHDLKTPLHGFSMCVDDLLVDSRHYLPDGKKKDSIISSIDLCKANCSFMTTAINRTVDFAKCASNVTLNPKMETTSIVEAVWWAVTCMKSSQSHIPIEVEPLDNSLICQYIITDKHWLMENILCYLSNAVKYSSGGAVKISISLTQDSKPTEVFVKPVKRPSFSKFFKASSSIYDTETFDQTNSSKKKGKDMLCFTVEDQGIGVDAEKKSSLFKPFQQTMRLAGGTGLGLYSLAKRVEALRGQYGVQSRKDGQPGSRFWFTVPYEPDKNYFVEEILVTNEPIIENATSPGASSSHVEVADSEHFTPRDSSPLALVVEDSVVITKSTKRMLTKAGYVVDVAENGAIGLEKMKKTVYQLVIMDLQMPIMDGLEAARRIRLFETELDYIESGKCKQFIIGVSANDRDEIRSEALASGMNAFVSKPFSFDDLLKFQNHDLDHM